jgi:hypothetical protein
MWLAGVPTTPHFLPTIVTFGRASRDGRLSKTSLAIAAKRNDHKMSTIQPPAHLGGGPADDVSASKSTDPPRWR